MRPSTACRAGAALLLACVLDAHAAGLDCARAASASERAICADASLRRLDSTLAAAYAAVLAGAPELRGLLREQQRTWLQEREPCGADTRCLTEHYQQRITELGKPDPADMAALETLRQAVEAARQTDPELPLEKTVERLRIRSGTTSFSNEENPRNPSGPARLPRARPSGVSAAEWRALLASRIDGGGESGQANYMLLDVDGDGLRDLVIDTLTGGTGMYRSVSVMRQAGGRFVVPGPASSQPDAAYLYALSERMGGNAADWIRLHGRAYVVYTNSAYGVDRVDLLHPWRGHGQVPRLTIRYRYRLSVPVVQEIGGRPARRLEPALHRALNEAVLLATPVAVPDIALAAGATQAKRRAPICPVPADAADPDDETYFSYGPGHYSYETIDDVPVRIGDQCYIGQVRDWYGGYIPQQGLEGLLCIRKPEQQDPQPDEDCYAVRGPRSVIGITARALPSAIRD